MPVVPESSACDYSTVLCGLWGGGGGFTGRGLFYTQPIFPRPLEHQPLELADAEPRAVDATSGQRASPEGDAKPPSPIYVRSLLFGGQ